MSEEHRDTPPGAHTLGGAGEPTQPERRILRQFALGVFQDDKDGHIFLGMVPVIDGVVRSDIPPYRFTKNNEETLEFFEKFKATLEGGKKRPAMYDQVIVDACPSGTGLSRRISRTDIALVTNAVAPTKAFA